MVAPELLTSNSIKSPENWSVNFRYEALLIPASSITLSITFSLISPVDAWAAMFRHSMVSKEPPALSAFSVDSQSAW